MVTSWLKTIGNGRDGRDHVLRQCNVFIPVCHSVHRGQGVYPSMHWGRHTPQADTLLGRHPPGRHPLGRPPTPLGRHPPPDRHPPLGQTVYGTSAAVAVCGGVSVRGGVSVWWGCILLECILVNRYMRFTYACVVFQMKKRSIKKRNNALIVNGFASMSSRMFV